ncbi:glutamine amidotransferase [Woodsholea maritima]|uniref:glutamine amidotransferase n=1 Tax=Woodsholea maritima TaxID=240237 RepID=UPI00036ADB53|nr:glutamine amidotransferase [Woodsholea maritima]
MKTAIAIRHIQFEDLGGFEPALKSAGYQVHYYDVGVHDLWTIEPVKTDLIILLGGPVGAYEGAIYPFIDEEIALVRTRMAANRPTLGICLGAQVMATALGARVSPGQDKEIGFHPVTLSQAGKDSVLAPFIDAPVTLHWHGDNFDLPAGCESLASTALCPHQAFRKGRNILGVQFHPEFCAPEMERWLIGHAHELSHAKIDLGQLRRDCARFAPELKAKAHQVMSAWLQQLEF